ncbi:MAG: TrbG/VirB9 family P-type conjugative transfer protein [Bdellovibrionaceae bacterium]|nr:TrbG/VirB9 family P-type conjugative transfer protein [Pseudobdellovibrionaceae bacterium]
MKPIGWVFILLSLSPLIAWGRVRKIEVKTDQIVSVKTSLGVATIIQVPDRPNSLVVGDQNAFKVEYLDQAITIKPLHSNARSNLYIYTDYRRFNVQLITTNESSADYVVYLENPQEKVKSSAIGWRTYRNHLNNESLVLETKRIAKMADGVLLIEFEVRSDAREKFRPDWLWLTQEGKTRPIHNLALSDQELAPGRPIKGLIQVLRADVSTAESLRVELRRKKTSFLTISSGILWR